MKKLLHSTITFIMLISFLQSCKKEKEIWTCKMHPAYTSDRPGQCPICNMDLVKKEKPQVTPPKSESHTEHEHGNSSSNPTNKNDADIDEGLTFTIYFADEDGDTYGSPDVFINSCQPTPPPGYSNDFTDCNDFYFFANPGATETCNGVDDNCDTNIDEGVLGLYFVDADMDGFWLVLWLFTI